MAAPSDRPDTHWSRRHALGVAGAGLAASAVGTAPAVAQGKAAKKVANLGMPWEDQYGYAQAIKVGDTIYVSGQLSHDDQGNMVAPAPLDAAGRIADHGNMGAQMAQSYANLKKVLASFGATMDDIVEEVVYVTDMEAAFAVAGAVRREAYGGAPVVASTILVTPRLAFPDADRGQGHRQGVVAVSRSQANSPGHRTVGCLKSTGAPSSGLLDRSPRTQCRHRT